MKHECADEVILGFLGDPGAKLGHSAFCDCKNYQPIKTKGLFESQFELSLWPSASVGCRPLMRKHSMASATSEEGAALGSQGGGKGKEEGEQEEESTRRRRERRRKREGSNQTFLLKLCLYGAQASH